MGDEVMAATKDGRLRLQHNVILLPPEGDTEGQAAYGYAHRLNWAVVGMAGAVSLVVDMGGFRAGDDNEEQARELGAYEVRGGGFAYVQAGLAARSVWAHARTRWPQGGDGCDEHCAVLEGQCWARLLLGEYQPELHELLVRLVQPGGPAYVWERLEEMYRDTFDAKPSEEHERAHRAQLAAQLAQARADGAARAVNGATQAAQDMQPQDARPE